MAHAPWLRRLAFPQQLLNNVNARYMVQRQALAAVVVLSTIGHESWHSNACVLCGYKVKEEHIPAITTAATATTTSATAQRNSTNTSTITVITKLPLPRPVCRERKKVIKDEGELARFKDTENKHCGQDSNIIT